MTLLDRIVDDTRARVARRKQAVPASDLEARPIFHAPRRPLAEALRQPDLAILAEIK